VEKPAPNDSPQKKKNYQEEEKLDTSGKAIS
jgi:hypothetical protein